MGSFCSLLLAGRVQVTLRLRVLRTAPSPSLTDVMTEVYVDVMGLSLNSGLRGMHVEQGDDAGLRIGPHVELRHEVIHGLRALRRHEGVLARGDDLREQRHLLLVCPLVRGRREAAWQRWGSGAPSPLLRCGGVLNSASLRLFIETVPIDISTARLVERRCGDPLETLLRPCKNPRISPSHLTSLSHTGYLPR
mmetsp:Transcript_17992/g.50493  ORF Transcript_17992/g.50493 Transcript_17992/m.50493 type:complete len:193 (+) Transcript_17992:378-956(+)